MKSILTPIIFFVLAFNIVSAQSTADRLKNYAKNNDYNEALALIPDAIRENPKDAGLFILCGDIYFEMEKLDSALIMYKKSDDIKGDQPVTMRKIARTLSYQGKSMEAIKEIKDAIDEDQEDVSSYLELGRIYLRADSINQAELVITKAREKNKTMPDAFVALGDLYFTQKIYALAISNYEDGLKLDPNLTDARIKLATAYYNSGISETDKELKDNYFGQSLKEWNTVTKKDPKNARAFYEQGRLFYFSGRHVEAAQSFYQYIQLRPTGSLGRWYLAQSLYEIGKCDSAAPHLKIVAQEIDSVKIKSQLLLARCLYEQKRYDESVVVYKNILSGNPIKLEIKDLDKFALGLLKSKDTTGAVKVYKELLAIDSSRCDLMYNLGQLMRYMKNYDDAIFFFSKRIINCKDEKSPKVLLFLGMSYFSKEKPDSALKYVLASIVLDTNDLTAHLYLADIHASLGNMDSSKLEFKLVIDKGKIDTAEGAKVKVSQAYLKLCGLYFKEKEYKYLQKISTQWTEYDPKSSGAYLYLAISYQAQSDIDNACRYYRKVLQLDPKNKDATDILKKLDCP